METTADLQKLVQRVEGMEKNWADFGYPVEMNSDTEPLLKKIKLEGGGTPNENDNDNTLLVVNVTARIAVLEEQWNKHFGDIPLEEPSNANIKSSLAPASAYQPANKPGRRTTRQERNQNGSGAKLSEFKCPECPEITDKITAMQAHVASAHGHEKPILPCALCGICFFNGKDRRIHAKTHRPACSICPRRFKRDVGVEEHMRVIHGFKTATACSECGARFGSIKDYVVHVQGHEKATGKTLFFRCTSCHQDRYFENDDLRLEHESKDHIFACHDCGEKLISRPTLQAHRRAHHQHKDKNSAPDLGDGQLNDSV